ncbi:hypothetical protein QOT17_000693 [Balamuthia mandrillaris]
MGTSNSKLSSGTAAGRSSFSHLSFTPTELSTLRQCYASLIASHHHPQQQQQQKALLSFAAFQKHLLHALPEELKRREEGGEGRFVRALFHGFQDASQRAQGGGGGDAEHLSEEQFLSGIDACLKSGLSDQFRFFFSLTPFYPSSSSHEAPKEEKQDEEEPESALEGLLTDCAILATASSSFSSSASSSSSSASSASSSSSTCIRETWRTLFAKPLCKGREQQQKEGSAGVEEFVSWAIQNMPYLFTSSVERFVERAFVVHSSSSPSSSTSSVQQQQKWRLPQVQHVRSTEALLPLPCLYALSLALPEKQTSWRLLYSSGDHGNSFNRFCHYVLGYEGPSVMLIRDMNGHLFGAYICDGWRDSQTYYGQSGSVLFSLVPFYAIYRATGKETNFVYTNTKKSSYLDLPVGVGFGGSIGNFRLWVDDDFAAGTSRGLGSTFERGFVVFDHLLYLLTVASFCFSFLH